MAGPERLTYRIEPHADGWAWRTVDMRGRTREHGRAPSRAAAAACVIRSITRSVSRDAGPNGLQAA